MAPSRIDRAKMIPASEDDTINVGSFYFGCLNLQRKTLADSYWIVLRLPREWLPHGFFDTRPIQDRVFPFWIVGKKQRVWLPRTSLFYLHQSQQDVFTNRAQRHDFGQFLDLIRGFNGNQETILSHFRKEALDSADQHNERRARMDKDLERRQRSLSDFMDDYAKAQQSRDSPARPPPPQTDQDINHPSRRQVQTLQTPQTRHRRDKHNSVTSRRQYITPHQARRRQQLINLNKRSSTNNIHPITPTIIPIKTEQEERHLPITEAIMSDLRVCVYVGRTNKEYVVDASLLPEGCPILHSMLSVDEGTGGLYIMHPRLHDVETEDFLLVLEFIQTGEYSPTLVDNPEGRDYGSLALYGLDTTEEYSAFLVQASRLYVLAEAFQVKGMKEMITRKVIRGQYRKYNHQSLIQFAHIIFTRPLTTLPGVAGPGHSRPRGRGRVQHGIVIETIDQWAIDELAENFMSIMREEAHHFKYLDMIEATADRNIHALVLEKAASNYRVVGGVPELIDDSD